MIIRTGCKVAVCFGDSLIFSSFSEKRLRFFFSSLLKTLPGVQRRLKSDGSPPSVGQMGALADRQSTEPWRDFSRSEIGLGSAWFSLVQPGSAWFRVSLVQGQWMVSKHKCFHRSTVYSADLESALHYLLRVELATHNSLEGEELKVFKDFVTLVSKVPHCHVLLLKLITVARVTPG